MRQTSRAVALLLVLESAQATANTPPTGAMGISNNVTVDIINNFNAAALITADNALYNRKASYYQALNTGWTWNDLVVK